MTKEDLQSAQTPIPQLFAYGIDADCHKVDSEESGFSYRAGISSVYSSRTGERVCRGDINGIGRAVSQSKWFNQLGGYYTFIPEVSDAIGGYPLGAILYYRDNQTGYIRVVRSLVPDNTYNFVEDPTLINNLYWSFVDNVPPSGFRPRIFQKPERVEGKLTIDSEPVLIKEPCVFTIQTGCDNLGMTDDNADFTLYVTVKRKYSDEFFTAGLICYLPSSASVISQGIISDPRSDAAAQAISKAFHAYNSPSPIQLYLLAGDMVKLTGNRNYDAIKSEEYQYWINPLTY